MARVERIAPVSMAQSRLVRALHRRREREAARLYLAEGFRLLEELADAPRAVRFLFTLEERVDQLESLFPNTPIAVVRSREFEAMSATEAGQGCGAVVEMPEPPSFDEVAETAGPILYLDRLADPGNVGTILRTADWFDIRTVLLAPDSVDLYNPKTVRSAMGSHLRLLVRDGVTPEMLEELNRPLVALDADAEERLGERPIPTDAIIAVGSEAHGIASEIRERARLLAIPQRGGGESLNAAMAAGIIMWEVGRTGGRGSAEGRESVRR